MSDLTTKGSDERNAVLATLRTLTEEQQYDLWGELWEGKHRRTYFTIKPKIVEVEAPAPPPPPAAPRNPAVLTAADLQAEFALAEERPLPSRAGFGSYLRTLSPSPEGLQFVMGSPPASPVLRCLKQALYDKLIVPESGYIGKVCLFDDSKFFPDHSQKSEKDTNMTLPGMLGHPLEFDLSWIDLKFEKFSHPDDIRRVLRGLTFKWVRGQNTPWLRLTLSGFEPYIQTDPLLPENQQLLIASQLQSFHDQGIWTRYRVRVLTPDGLAQRITSSEAFRVEVSSAEGGLGELHGPVHLKVLLGDQLYTCI